MNNVRIENKKASELLHEAFNQANNIVYPETFDNREYSENLQKQISIIQLEKESVIQLWQMALKAVDTLEQELKGTHKDGKTIAYYEGQVNNVKETYSEAIKELEIKLLQVKENFTKHQALWDSTREKMTELKNEKTDFERQLINLSHEFTIKEQNNCKIIETLQFDLKKTRQDLETIKISKIKLENALEETRNCAKKFAEKDKESQEKVAEALEIVEIAMRDKEQILQRELRIIEEKTKLEVRLADLAEEFAARLEKELIQAKDSLEKNIKKYVYEIKELKAQLRDKTTIIDRVQRESQLYEEELEKIRHNTDNFLQQSNTKVLELEEKLKITENKLEINEEICRHKYEEKIRISDSRILALEDKLTSSNDRLRRNQVYSTREIDDRLREADERVKEAMERYSNLEKRLTRTLEEREIISSELRTLQLNYERELGRKENERRLLESRIRDCQEDVRKANNLADKSAIRSNGLARQVESLEKEMQELKNQYLLSNTCNQTMEGDQSMHLRTMQEKYEERISELTKYVKTHQKLSKRYFFFFPSNTICTRNFFKILISN